MKFADDETLFVRKFLSGENKYLKNFCISDIIHIQIWFPKPEVYYLLHKFKLGVVQIVRHQSVTMEAGCSGVTVHRVDKTWTAWPWIHEDTTLLAHIGNYLLMKTVWHPTRPVFLRVSYKSGTYSATPNGHLACLTVRKFRLFISSHWYYYTSTFSMPQAFDLFISILIIKDPFVILQLSCLWTSSF